MRRNTRSIALAVSNPVPSVADRAAIVGSLIDGQVIEKHEIVWNKHKNSLDTPDTHVILQHIFGGE